MGVKEFLDFCVRKGRGCIVLRMFGNSDYVGALQELKEKPRSEGGVSVR